MPMVWYNLHANDATASSSEPSENRAHCVSDCYPWLITVSLLIWQMDITRDAENVAMAGDAVWRTC
jgi:hypothetical protein